MIDQIKAPNHLTYQESTGTMILDFIFKSGQGSFLGIWAFIMFEEIN